MSVSQQQVAPMKPYAIQWPRKSVETFAETIASSEAVNYQPADNISDVVERIGGRLAVTDVWASGPADGSLHVDGDGQFWIVLPSHTSGRRDRFTIAHELGHYFLHYLTASADQRQKGMVATRYGSDRVEWEANWFAAAFLMPESKFKDVFADRKGSTIQISDYFDVSEQAVEVRARVLGLK